MEEIAKKHTERLPELKKSVEEAHMYFRNNIDRYNKFINFVFKSSMTDDEVAALADRGFPSIEFNILEAIVSKLRGEFAKQQPSLSVRAADGVPTSMLTPQFIETIDVVEAHLRSIFFDGTNDMLGYNLYTDCLAGGYSVARVFTKYVNERSLEQNICVERAYDPTLCVFDPLARESHKGDGRFCAELYPMTSEAFKEEFGTEALENIKFTRSLSGFDWSFQNEQEKILLVCDYYEKKNKKDTIHKISNGQMMTTKEFKLFMEKWEAKGLTEQAPVIVSSRQTTFETIVRYRFCEGRILDVLETNYKYLPLVFIDGNSIQLKDGGSYVQMTRPYVYHAMGIQRLKNLAGQSLGNELENTIQHKFIVAKEAIPEYYQNAYTNVQKASTLVYNHFLDNNPTVELPAPREVARTPIPPEITATFKLSDEMTQMILGAYDQSAGVAGGNLSGVAFARSAIQSNTAAMPYYVGYLKGLGRLAEIIVDMIPKYYRTPRSLPILKPDGKRSYEMINQPNSLYMNFDPNSLQVKVDTGVNFAMQKEIALQTIVSLSQSMKNFGDFFADKGLQTLLDNIDIRGIDGLKEKAEEYQKEQAQMRQMGQQIQQMQLKMQMQKMQMDLAKMQKDLQAPSQGQLAEMALQEQAQNDAVNNAIKERDAETRYLDLLRKIQADGAEEEVRKAEIDAENTRTAVDSMLNISKHIHEVKQAKTESLNGN